MYFRFYCDLPDEFLFAPTANLFEVAHAVKLGERIGKVIRMRKEMKK